MQKLDLSTENWQKKAINADGPACLIIRAWLEPVAGMDRFQPTGFPEIGHVIYDAPREDSRTAKVCIVDSPASMANHLEMVCLDGPTGALHPDLAGLPHVCCVTDNGGSPSEDDPLDRLVCTTLTEGHRLASDYFLDASVSPKWEQEKTIWTGRRFREQLREELGIEEVKKDKTYFIWPGAWWTIYRTFFKYDPNSLVHGVMFAREQIKITRMLTAHMEAFGASRVGSSGVKFDKLGKTLSGQPIFAVDEETAHTIVATFILDLALLRSYGRGDEGLISEQKHLLLDLAIWKVKQLLQSPFRYRTGCQLVCSGITWWDDTDGPTVPSALPEKPKKPDDLSVDIRASISACRFDSNDLNVYYPAAELFKIQKDSKEATSAEARTLESDTEEAEGK